jgi:hypothetical protein
MSVIHIYLELHNKDTLWTCDPQEDDQGRVMHLIQFLMFGILILW